MQRKLAAIFSADVQGYSRLMGNDAEAYTRLGATLLFAGQAEEAVGRLEQAIRLDPHYPPLYVGLLGAAYYRTGQLLQAEMRSVASLATDVALEVTSTAFRFGAGSAIRLEHVLQRCLRDLHTAAAHFMVNDSSYEQYGQFLLGLSEVDPMQ